MQPINPSRSNYNRVGGALRIAQSVQKVMANGVQFAQPIGQNSQGIYNKFQQDNGNGVMVRIGAAGSGEFYTFPSTPGSPVVINHGLQRQPIGFFVHDIDGDARVYRTAAPDKNQITLACTSSTINVTVYIT